MERSIKPLRPLSGRNDSTRQRHEASSSSISKLQTSQRCTAPPVNVDELKTTMLMSSSTRAKQKTAVNSNTTSDAPVPAALVAKRPLSSSPTEATRKTNSNGIDYSALQRKPLSNYSSVVVSPEGSFNMSTNNKTKQNNDQANVLATICDENKGSRPQSAVLPPSSTNGRTAPPQRTRISSILSWSMNSASQLQNNAENVNENANHDTREKSSSLSSPLLAMKSSPPKNENKNPADSIREGMLEEIERSRRLSSSGGTKKPPVVPFWAKTAMKTTSKSSNSNENKNQQNVPERRPMSSRLRQRKAVSLMDAQRQASAEAVGK